MELEQKLKELNCNIRTAEKALRNGVSNEVKAQLFKLNSQYQKERQYVLEEIADSKYN